MKCLKRNMTTFEYMPYTGEETDLNDDGEHTGEFHLEYGDPVEYKGNISTPSGQTQPLLYGEDIRYTHTLVMENPDVEIHEHGKIVWDGKTFEVTAVRKSINSVSVALRLETENHYEPYEPESDGG